MSFKTFFKKSPAANPIKDQLVFLFKGTDGHDYFSYKPDSDLHMPRLPEQMKLMEHMRIGMSEEDMFLIFDNIDTLNAAILTTKNDKDKPSLHANIGAHTTIGRGRMSNTLHHKLLLQMAATWCIRNDENPQEFSREIHEQKVNFFDAECREGSAYAFFQLIGFRGLSRYMTMSGDEFSELWTNSILNLKTLHQTLENLIPERLRRSSLKTSASR